MEPKDKFEAFMRLAEFQQTGIDSWINIEWKMTTVLWTAIFLAKGYLKTNSVPTLSFAWIFYIAFWLVYIAWLGFLDWANKIDMTFKEYYRNQIGFKQYNYNKYIK